MNLYELDDAILDCVDTETGDIVDIEKLEALEMERNTKISNIACWIKNLEANAEAIKAEKKNLEKRQKTCENQASRLREYLQGYLAGAKFEDARCVISYRSSTSTEIAEGLDVNTLPDECKKITITPNKDAIKAALMLGEVIEGCKLIQKSNMQIK